ncbi:MAG: hypothetical protein ACLTA1_15570, partial [Clostridia bacterium]
MSTPAGTNSLYEEEIQLVDWWNHLTLTQQVFAGFGMVGTAVLILQTVMLLFGLGHDSMDSDADVDADLDDVDDIA